MIIKEVDTSLERGKESCHHLWTHTLTEIALSLTQQNLLLQ